MNITGSLKYEIQASTKIDYNAVWFVSFGVIFLMLGEYSYFSYIIPSYFFILQPHFTYFPDYYTKDKECFYNCSLLHQRYIRKYNLNFSLVYLSALDHHHLPTLFHLLFFISFTLTVKAMKVFADIVLVIVLFYLIDSGITVRAVQFILWINIQVIILYL